MCARFDFFFNTCRVCCSSQRQNKSQTNPTRIACSLVLMIFELVAFRSSSGCLERNLNEQYEEIPLPEKMA